MTTGLPALIETMRIARGTLPLLDRHITRLNDSCHVLQLMAPPSDTGTEAQEHGMRPPADRVVRIQWDGGTMRWDDRDLTPAPTRVVVVAEPHRGYAHKTTDRTAFDRAQEQAQGRGGEEALLLTEEGFVAEAARFAVAWVDGNSLRVPALDLGILPSIGRARLLELAGDVGLRVEPGRYPPEALEGRPVALINAVQGVVPVRLLDGLPLPPDPRLAEAQSRFWPSA